MVHDIRALRNHRDLAARAVTVASEMPPRKTTAAAKPTAKVTTKVTAKVTAKVTQTATVTKPVVSPATTSVPVVKSPDTATDKSLVAATPSTTLPSTISPTSLVVASTPSSISTSTPASVKVTTVTTVEKAKASTTTSSSATTTPQPSGAVTGGAVAGAVIGGLAGLALLAAVVFFLVRRYRKSSTESWAFNADKFRRTALLLDDPPAPPEKPMQQQRGPRPPTMIARHMNAPAVPPTSASTPYGEHATHSADPYGNYAASAAQYNVGMYGADGQVSRDPYADIYGANPMYGQHTPYGQAAHGAPPSQFQFPQRQPFTQQSYSQQYPSQQDMQTSFAANVSLPNPFSNAPAITVSTYSAASSSHSSHSHSGSDTSSSNGSTTSPAVLHRRQPTQGDAPPPAYEEDPNYVNLQRDVKVSPGALAVRNTENEANSPTAGASSSKPIPPTPTTSSKRPTSAFTVYDPADAYGGM